MKNKELLLRRMQTLEGLLKRTRVYLSENRVQDAKKVIVDTWKAVRRENDGIMKATLFLAVLSWGFAWAVNLAVVIILQHTLDDAKVA